jgi:peptide deformylase
MKELETEPEKELTKIIDTVYINPQIKKVSRKKRQLDEGCLSVRYLYGKVKRAEKVTLEAYNEKGEKFTKGGSGLLAQIFQHETDHLDGVLFIDKAENVVEVLPEKETKNDQRKQ